MELGIAILSWWWLSVVGGEICSADCSDLLSPSFPTCLSPATTTHRMEAMALCPSRRRLAHPLVLDQFSLSLPLSQRASHHLPPPLLTEQRKFSDRMAASSPRSGETPADRRLIQRLRVIRSPASPYSSCGLNWMGFPKLGSLMGYDGDQNVGGECGIFIGYGVSGHLASVDWVFCGCYRCLLYVFVHCCFSFAITTGVVLGWCFLLDLYDPLPVLMNLLYKGSCNRDPSPVQGGTLVFRWAGVPIAFWHVGINSPWSRFFVFLLPSLSWYVSDPLVVLGKFQGCRCTSFIP